MSYCCFFGLERARGLFSCLYHLLPRPSIVSVLVYRILRIVPVLLPPISLRFFKLYYLHFALFLLCAVGDL